MINFNAREAYDRYLAGESLTQLAIAYGVAKGDTIKARILKDGINFQVRGVVHNRLSIDIHQILKLYRSGFSVKKIAEHLGCNRSVIIQRLKENGIIQRNRSESMFLRMEQTSPEERQRLSAAAHNAIRGKKKTIKELRKRAIGKQNIKYSSPIELELIKHFRDLGIEVIPQKAIGVYNIDIAFAHAPIAVEVFGGHWHTVGRHAKRFRKRLDYIIKSGWIFLICLLRS